MTSTKRNISQPISWWAAFQAEADKRGETLSEWLGNAALASLPRAERRKLCERPPAHRPNGSK